MTFEQILFILFAGIVVGGAVSVLLQRNPLYSAFALITTFVGLACVYVTLKAQFLGAVQIVVYAGAIMMLFVFVIMLLNVRDDQTANDSSRFLTWLAIPLGGILLGALIYVLTKVDINPVTNDAGGTVERIGTNLLTKYLLPFEATSVLILMAVVGALHLAKREKE